MNPETARTVLAVCRQICEHGKELEPHLLAELEAISIDNTLAWSLRCEAEVLIELERGA